MHVHSHGAAHNHSHPPIDASQGMTLILGTAVVATFALVAVELIAGYAAHSIALISDALHNLTDVPTMVISWLAARWAMRPPTPEKTYGYHRTGILAAFINSMLLAIVALFLIYESIQRLRVPVEVESGVMLWVSILALVVNSGITFALHSGRRDLNIRAVWIHNLGDALSNIAIIAGAIVIRRTGANWIDPVIGIAIGAMVLWTGAGILRESTHILLEGLPRNIDLEKCRRCHPEGRWRTGSPRYPHLDAGHRSPRTLVPRPHPGYAYGRQREDPYPNLRSSLTRFPNLAHHGTTGTRRPPSRSRPLNARARPIPPCRLACLQVA